MTDATPEACDATSPVHCITCGDIGVPMRVIELAEGYAECLDGDGVRHSVLLDLVAPRNPGDGVLVHAGVAIAPLEVAPR